MNTQNNTSTFEAESQQSQKTIVTPPPLPLDEAAASKAEKRQRFWRQLPKVLRWIGGTTLLISAASFLLSGWTDTPSIWRYGSFLAFTAVLTGCGFFCISRWKDNKGARTFMALATAIIPAHFAMLGALIFAEIDGQSTFQGHLEAFSFEALGPIKLAITLAVALLVLIPVAYVGFSAMARHAAKQLTIIYTLANACLLLPIRNGDWIAGLCFLMMGALIAMDRRKFATIAPMKSWDGIAVRCMLFVPLPLMVGRSLLLHEISQLLFSLMAASIACVSFFGLPRCTKNIKVQMFFQFISLIPSMVAWIICADLLFLNVSNFDELIIPTLALPLAALLLTHSFYGVGTGIYYRRFSATIAVFAIGLQTLMFGGPITAVFCIVISAAVIIASFAMEEKGLFYAGVLGLVFGLFYHLRFAIELYQTNMWLSLAIAGAVVVLISSYVERHGRTLIERGIALRHRLDTWK